MNKKKIIVSILITFAIILVTSVGTYSLWKYISTTDANVNTITYGLDYYINYAKGQDLTSGTLEPGSTYTSGNSADIELWKKDNTYDIYGHIYLNINAIGDNLANSSALKYALVTDNTVISEGSLNGTFSGETILLKGNIPLSTTKQIFTIYVWIDENEEINTDAEEETLSVSVRCEATMKEIVFP